MEAGFRHQLCEVRRLSGKRKYEKNTNEDSRKEKTQDEALRCKEELKEAMSPQEATSPMKTPVRRCSCAQKCISGSRLGWFLRWVLLVGSLGCVGGSFSVPLSPCCLDALNYCPSGCHSVNFRPIASDNNLCHGVMENCSGVSCCSVEATGPDGLPLSAPVPYLQLGKHAVGLPTCDSGCNAVFLTNVGLPTIVSHNFFAKGSKATCGSGLTPTSQLVCV